MGNDALETQQKIITYDVMGKIALKKGLFKSARDPSVDLEREINSYLSRQKQKFNERVSNTFDIVDGEFTKYEFL